MAEEQKEVQTEDVARAHQEELLRKVDEYLNIEEIVIKYNGIRTPVNPSQLSVELSALRNLKSIIDRISQLENEWTIYLEKNKIALAFIEQAKNKDTENPPTPPEEKE
jgi:hypothetical protein